MTRVFVTGGTGFVGGAPLRRLQQAGEDVVALARSTAAEAALRARDVDVVGGDVLDEDALARGMAGREVAYHVAGVNTHCPEDPERLLRVNGEGPVNAVRAAARAGVRRLVLTSSAATLGEAHGTVGHEGCPHRGWYLSLYLSIVDVDDCAEGHVLATERGTPGRRYVLNGATASSGELLRIAAAHAGHDGSVRMLPAPVVRVAAALETGLRAVRRRPPICRARARTILHGHRYDGSLATRELGLAYRPVAETLRRTIDWAVGEGLVVGRRQTRR